MKSYYYEKSKNFKTYQIQRLIGKCKYPWVIWGYDDDFNSYCKYVDCFETLRDAREYVKSL